MMTISEYVSIALMKAKKQKKELAHLFGYSQQSMSNKFARNSWTVPDMVRVAEFVNGRLVFVCSDGQELPLTPASCPVKKQPTNNSDDVYTVDSAEYTHDNVLEDVHQTDEDLDNVVTNPGLMQEQAVHYFDESKAVEFVKHTHDKQEPLHQKDEDIETIAISNLAVIPEQDMPINHSDESKTIDTVERNQDDVKKPIHQNDETEKRAPKKAKKTIHTLPGQTSLFDLYNM